MFYLFQVTHEVKTKNSSEASNTINTWLSLELWTAAAASYVPNILLGLSPWSNKQCLYSPNWTSHATKTKNSKKASNTAKSWLSLEHQPCELLLPHPDGTYVSTYALSPWLLGTYFTVSPWTSDGTEQFCASLNLFLFCFFLNASIVRNDVVIFFFKSEQERIKKLNGIISWSIEYKI